MKKYTARISLNITEEESGIPNVEQHVGEIITVISKGSPSPLRGCLPDDKTSYLWDASWLTDLKEIDPITEVTE